MLGFPQSSLPVSDSGLSIQNSLSKDADVIVHLKAVASDFGFKRILYGHRSSFLFMTVSPSPFLDALSED